MWVLTKPSRWGGSAVDRPTSTCTAVLVRQSWVVRSDWEGGLGEGRAWWTQAASAPSRQGARVSSLRQPRPDGWQRWVHA